MKYRVPFVALLVVCGLAVACREDPAAPRAPEAAGDLGPPCPDPVACDCPPDDAAPEPEPEPEPTVYPVRLGVDRLLDDEIDRVRGKRVGLVTNASGVDGALVPTADRLAADARVQLVQLYAPEHGLRGAARAGADIDDELDPVTGVTVESLYGDRRAPSQETLERLDVLLFDIQDVGSRTYTYASTLGYTMQAAARAGIPLIVLDRPNPQGGLRFEGPIREEDLKSFVGWGPLPVSHGMTMGELARFYEGELGIGCDLTVLEMSGWHREMVWQDTGLTWVPTSPNIPHARNAQLYIATGMVAGVSRNINESAGYTMPFETLAATFIDAPAFAQAMNAAGLDGVRFRPISYEPRSGRFRGETVHGVQLVLDDPRTFRPLRTALTALVEIERLYPGRFEARGVRSFARIWGNEEVLKRIRRGESVATIEASWRDALDGFAARRARYLIYE